ncbi:hypothetical protein ACG94V_14260 [Acinetobacter sp. ULE_I001]|uniref:hypothetical protein n=1 Tax=Acinetobacter TaxID=469 RepID=UPI00264F5EF0|nr:hypothetical protein [Acinetobacter sp.]
MKKYFTLEESLNFLNKDIGEYEKLTLRDLFFLSAKKYIQPCFYYRGEALWQETNEYGNKDKIYEVNELCIYASFGGIGQRLLESFDMNEYYFFTRWVYEVEFLVSEIPEHITQIRLYNRLEDEKELQAELLNLIKDKDTSYYGLNSDLSDPETYREFLELAYISCPPVKIDFNNVYLEKKELIKLLNNKNIFETHINEPVQDNEDRNKELGTKESNNVSLIIGAMAELLKFDLTKPFGDSNKEIKETIERMGGKLGKDTIGRWLGKARDNYK